MAANNNVCWNDSAITLLELLQTRGSLWNVKAASYRDRNKKKSGYEEILVGREDDVHVPGINLVSLKVFYKYNSLQIFVKKQLVNGMWCISIDIRLGLP